mmetsp:Transcript_46691/g.83587  ORF Transcript_46691/g.83587 Transcript_46691/m.83587 type:complete len:253 (-) Transcript_46691:1027-1785(-)
MGTGVSGWYHLLHLRVRPCHAQGTHCDLDCFGALDLPRALPLGLQPTWIPVAAGPRHLQCRLQWIPGLGGGGRGARDRRAHNAGGQLVPVGRDQGRKEGPRGGSSAPHVQIRRSPCHLRRDVDPLHSHGFVHRVHVPQHRPGAVLWLGPIFPAKFRLGRRQPLELDWQGHGLRLHFRLDGPPPHCGLGLVEQQAEVQVAPHRGVGDAVQYTGHQYRLQWCWGIYGSVGSNPLWALYRPLLLGGPLHPEEGPH